MRAIDADELKEQFSWSEVCRLSILEINQIIDDAPTIRPEDNSQRTGEWMVVDDVYCQCPFCNKVEVIFADYCRKCGARLHEPEVE